MPGARSGRGPGLDRRTRSAITLTALVARGHHDELELHLRAALRNGLTADEIKEVLLQSAIYCGVPAANSAFAIAQSVLRRSRVRVSRPVVILGCPDADRPVWRRVAGVRPDDLAAHAIGEADERPRGPDPIEDVWFGCANQAGEDNPNVARFASLLAGLPRSGAGVTVNRLCGSGLARSWGCQASARVTATFVAGGVESMSRAPFVSPRPTRLLKGDRTPHDTDPRLAFLHPRSRSLPARVDGGNSQGRPALGRSPGRIRTPCRGARRAGGGGRAGGGSASPASRAAVRGRSTSILGLDTSARKRDAEAVVSRGGTVTAGNSSGINDGAAAFVVASDEKARELGIEPLGVFRGLAVAGVDPRVMGIGPVPAAHKLLARTGMPSPISTSSSSTRRSPRRALAVVRELGLDPDRVNVNGGAIALGHPLGMCGARLGSRFSTRSGVAMAAMASRPSASAWDRARRPSSSD